MTIPWVGPTLNSLWSGKHWSFRKQVADSGHKAVITAKNGVEPFYEPVELEFRFHIKGRRFDCSNMAVTIKAIEDGLVLCGIIPNDGPNDVRKITIYAPEKSKTQSYTIVKIKEYSSETPKFLEEKYTGKAVIPY